MSILEQDIYTIPTSSIIGTNIREYDIKQANINILFSEGAISKDRYEYLKNIPKIQREITIGIARKKDPNLTKIIKQGILKARLKLGSVNDIKDSEILSIKNDAVFIIDRDIPEEKRRFGNIFFDLKNHYTSFYKIYNMEFYYDRVNDKLDVKGMGDSIHLHEEYFGDLLKFVFYTMETNSPVDSFNVISQIIKTFSDYKYPIEYYREFNNRSLYKSKIQIAKESYYFIDKDSYMTPENLDISYNFGILMEIRDIAIRRIL